MTGYGETLGLLGQKALDHGLDLAAEDTLVGAGKTGVTEKRGATWEDLFVCRLNVGVGPDHDAYLAVKEAADGDFLGGGLCVDINKNNGCMGEDGSEFVLGGSKRVLEAGHEGPALQVDHANQASSFGFANDASGAGGAGRVIGGSKKTVFIHQQLGDLFLVPEVVSGGDNINAGRKDL